jgi:hypothetical protein
VTTEGGARGVRFRSEAQKTSSATPMISQKSVVINTSNKLLLYKAQMKFSSGLSMPPMPIMASLAVLA